MTATNTDEKYITKKNIPSIIAKKLNQGKIICVFQGKSEFGPRSLGNRSILAQAIDPKINNLLNRKLGRTEFMPFAPITLDSQSKKMYLNFTKGANAAMYMTTTFNCTNVMKKKSPAAVHIDGTARPQILHKKQNQVLFYLL